jgi:uncharacterized protein (TIGR03905 family)
MKYYKTFGTCSKEIGVELDENGLIKEVEFVGGCDGNTHGIMSLVKGAKAEEVMEKLRGINCGKRGTSCPDQLSRALEEVLKHVD